MINGKAAPETGWLAGRVMDNQGRGLPRARIMAWTCSGETHVLLEVAAGDDGCFRLGPLPSCAASVFWCEAPGYARLRMGDEHAPEIAIFPDAIHDLGDIVLAPEIAASGKVLDPEGQPIAGASIVATLYHHELAHTIIANGPPINRHTEGDGSFRIGSLAPGSLKVEVAVPGYPRARTGALLSMTSEQVDLGVVQFDRATVLMAGVVTDRRGVPASGARVSANEDHEMYTTTDDTGRFSLMVRSRNVWYARVSLPGSAYAQIVMVTDPANVKASIERPRFIDGTVRDAETKRPVAIENLNICEVRRREVDGTEVLLG